MTILQDLSQAELIAQVQALQAKLARQSSAKLRLKVTDKGCVGLIGLRKFPISLYRDEWETVLNFADDIREFIADNSDRLPGKGDNAE